jgi:pyruvyltransferase
MIGTFKPIRAYWWKEVPNFGDVLMGLILAQFAEIKVKWAPVSKAQIVPGGSVLEHVPPLWDGYIIGAGKLYEKSDLHLHTGTMTILGLRGPLTARQCPPGNYAIGDPGLLSAELVPVQGKRFDLGLVPHWSDATLQNRPEFRGEGWSTHVINPRRPPLEVLAEISQCRRIVTSSLHGLIVADAYGLARRFEPAGVTSLRAGLFQYLDYSASIDLPLEAGVMQEANQNRVEDRRYELFDAYRDLHQILRRQQWHGLDGLLINYCGGAGKTAAVLV